MGQMQVSTMMLMAALILGAHASSNKGGFQKPTAKLQGHPKPKGSLEPTLNSGSPKRPTPPAAPQAPTGKVKGTDWARLDAHLRLFHGNRGEHVGEMFHDQLAVIREDIRAGRFEDPGLVSVVA